MRRLAALRLYAQCCRHSLSTWGEMREVAVTHSLLEEKCAKLPSLTLYLRRNAQSAALALYLRRNSQSCRHSRSTWGEMREVAVTRALLEEECAKLPSLALYLRNARSCFTCSLLEEKFEELPHSLSTWEEMRRAAAQMTLLKVQQHLGGALQVGLPQVGESGHSCTVQHPSTEDC